MYNKYRKQALGRMYSSQFRRQRFSEGAWCPADQKMSDCQVLFVGDSQFRYLSEHIPDKVNNFVPSVYFRSGAKVDDLFQDLSALDVSQKTRACVIHVGTNNLKVPTVTAPQVLADFQYVLADLVEMIPDSEIFISSVLPRCVDQWDNTC